MSDIRVFYQNDSAPAGLFCLYPKQTSPQPVHLYLDKSRGIPYALYVDWSGEVGNAVPIAVWKGEIQTVRLPVLKAKYANKLLDEVHTLLCKYLETKEDDTPWHLQDVEGLTHIIDSYDRPEYLVQYASAFSMFPQKEAEVIAFFELEEPIKHVQSQAHMEAVINEVYEKKRTALLQESELTEIIEDNAFKAWLTNLCMNVREELFTNARDK
jgi:hypothetical protein